MADRPRLHAALFTIAALCLLLDAGFLLTQMVPGGYRPDFTVFWAAGATTFADPARAYDAAWLTAAQAPLAGSGHGLRPFAYPPTALLLFAPFSRLPFPLAMALWAASTAALFAAAARARFGGPATALSLMAPPVILCLATGQTSLLTAAALFTALPTLDSHPRRAGLLLGLVAALKPQTMVLLPLALIRARRWEALATATLTGFAAAATATLVFGPALWLDWLAAMRAFPGQTTADPVEGVTVAAAAHVLGLPVWARIAVQGAAALLGAGLVWRAFGAQDGTGRIIALAAGALLVSPYAMGYELAPLVPPMAAALLLRKTPALLAAPLLTGLAAPWGLAALALTRCAGRDQAGSAPSSSVT